MDTGATNDLQAELQKYRSFITGQLNSKAEPQAIIDRLVAMGVDQAQAGQMVHEVQCDAISATKGEAVVSTSIPMAIVGGVLAALIGGCIWGAIVKLTDFEIGYMAWGIGVLCGLGVVTFSGGKRGTPYQVIAVSCSLLGILIGKYASFYFAVKQYVAEHGRTAATGIPFFSPKLFVIFFTKALPDILRPLDIVFVVLAVLTASKITRRKA